MICTSSISPCTIGRPHRADRAPYRAGRSVFAATGFGAETRVFPIDINLCRCIDSYVETAGFLFRLLADPARFRLLRVLARDRFNVTELTGILGLAQSGVSRHLGLLRDAGLVAEQREGGFVYYGLAPQAHADGRSPLWELLEEQFAAARHHRVVREDEVRLQEVLRQRKENFDTPGDRRQLVPGRSWAAWSRALGHLLPPLDAVDIGCGEGYLTLEIARWARSVIGIDRSDDVLERAKEMALRRQVNNVEWKKGDLARLPLRDASVDLALLSQSLHHASDPERAVAEAVRVLRPGGRVLILELRQHAEAWVRPRYGHQRLGFTPFELERLLEAAGLADSRVSIGARKAGDPFVVLIASGAKARAAGVPIRTRP
jgi:ArsR family transcriptional regulator